MAKSDYKELLQKFSQVLEESLALLKQAAINEHKTLTQTNIPVTSLLDQCVSLCEQYHADLKEPLRIIHHFGLPNNSPLIACLATLPNTRVLNDINPNNSGFKDILKSQTLSVRNIGNAFISREIKRDEEERLEAFLNDLQYFLQQCNKIGQRLLVCNNHCLSRTTANDARQLLDFQALLNSKFETKSVVIVTDPVVGYQAYCDQSGAESTDFDFDQYCQRMLDFIQTHSDLIVVRHEDFMAESDVTMQLICRILDLPFNDDFMILREAFN